MNNKIFEWAGVTTAVLYSLFVALNIGIEFIGFSLLLLSAILIGIWAYRGKHKGILLLQFFYASAGVIGMIRWFWLKNGIKKDLKLPLSIIIAAIIIAGAIYYSSTSAYRNALKACEALMMSDGSVTKKDLKEQDVFKNYLIPECVSDKLKGND